MYDEYFYMKAKGEFRQAYVWSILTFVILIELSNPSKIPNNLIVKLERNFSIQYFIPMSYSRMLFIVIEMLLGLDDASKSYHIDIPVNPFWVN